MMSLHVTRNVNFAVRDKTIITNKNRWNKRSFDGSVMDVRIAIETLEATNNKLNRVINREII